MLMRPLPTVSLQRQLAEIGDRNKERIDLCKDLPHVTVLVFDHLPHLQSC